LRRRYQTLPVAVLGSRFTASGGATRGG
jgi:hypothetical protein